MTQRPYEVLARFGGDSKVAGVSVRYIASVNGKEYEGDPQPLSGTDDPAFAVFAESFSAAVVAERDSLANDKATLTTNLATANATIATRDATITQHETTISARDATIETMQADATAAATAAQEAAATAAASIAELTAEKQTLTQQVATLTTEKAAVQAELDDLKASLIPGPRQITPGQLLERISPELMVKIWNSGLPIAGIACATLFTWQGFIDLDSDRLAAILKSLEDAGLLSADDVAKMKA